MNFICKTCEKQFKPTLIGGELYMVRGIHFATNEAEEQGFLALNDAENESKRDFIANGGSPELTGY